MPRDAENAAYDLLRQIEAKKATCGGSVPLGFDAEWKVIGIDFASPSLSRD